MNEEIESRMLTEKSGVRERLERILSERSKGLEALTS